MDADSPQIARSLCLCGALRKASRAVSRLYDDELRKVGLRATQFSLLSHLKRVGEVKQGDLGELMFLEETTITRNVRPLLKNGWLAIRAGKDRREKLISMTAAGEEKYEQALPAWKSAQSRMKSTLPDDVWRNLLVVLPEVAAAAVVD